MPIEGLNAISCEKCNFEYAFIRYFAGDQSRRLFQEKLKTAKHNYLLSVIEHNSDTNRFTLMGDSVAFVSEKDKTLSIIKGDRSIEKSSGILQCSASERNRAILHDDGKISVEGDNSYGQCDTQELKDIEYVLCAPNCVYAVNKAGDVAVVGAVLDHDLKKWKNIKTLACGSYHVLGLTKDNTVKIAGDMIDNSVIETVSGWKNVKSVAAATDCAVALFQDGTVGFAGRKDDPRNNVKDWKKIVSVSVDSSYVIGITEDGEIRLAGSCKSFLDMGRSSAKDWKNVVAVTCSRSGIAAILQDGTLKIAGNFSGDINEVCETWKKNVEI
jgi:alpha-tubulin suppressor-like RCC1 family protein